MEMLKLTVQDAVETLLMSQSSVYAWIEKGKLKYEDFPTGKLIVISRKEAEEIRELNQKSRRNKVAKQSQKPGEQFQETPAIEAEYNVNYEDNLTNYAEDGYKEQMAALSEGLVMHITKLAKDAGKLALLEDLSKSREQDVKYWKDNYFQVMQERDSLKEERIKQSEVISRRELEIEAQNRQIAELKRALAKAKSPVATIKRALLGK